MTDPISDMLTQIRNALAVKKPFISLPHSKLKHNLASLLVRRGYLKSAIKLGRGVKKYLKIELEYKDGIPAIEELKRISKPGMRIYISKDKIKPIKSGLGHSVISTSKGLMFDYQAKRNNLGGEVICQIF
jgi:small subunit ribosomal protein S8